MLEKLIADTLEVWDGIGAMVKNCRRKIAAVDNDTSAIKIAVNTAEDIIDRYEYVQHINRQADGDQASIRLELEILGNTNLPPLRPRYKYWTDFSPEVGIGVLKTLQSSVNKVGTYLRDRVNRLIKKLEVILRPFRVQPVETIAAPSLGLKPYKFNSYANWVQSFSDHGMTYALWRECGFE